jgi:hypothetical protein
MQLRNTEYNFSFYNNLLSANAPDDEFDVNQLIETIKYGYLKVSIELLRNEKDKKKRGKIKQYSLPCVTLSGSFKLRNSKNLLEHSGLMQIDIDDVKDYNTAITQIINDEFTYVAFKSPSGNGIKVIVKINPSEETHLEQFFALQRYYKEEYNIVIDEACKDVARCMLLSYDANIFCNPFSEVYAELYMPQPKVIPKSYSNLNYTINVDSNNEIDIIENLTLEIEKNNIDITNGYENWIRVGFSLASSLGENGRHYFQRLSKFNKDYNPNTCDKQFTKLLKRNNGAISLGTLIHIAKENGIQILFPTLKKQELQSSSRNKNKENNTSTLYDVLKAKRLELAKQVDKPAFTIFTNKALEDLVQKQPKSEKELVEVYGFSKNKCNKYANDILPLIVNFKSDALVKIIPLDQKYIIPKLNIQDESLFSNLKKLRLKLALEKGLKAFHIFGNTTLYEIISHKPTNKTELLKIKGIGQKKVELFGTVILELINN